MWTRQGHHVNTAHELYGAATNRSPIYRRTLSKSERQFFCKQPMTCTTIAWVLALLFLPIVLLLYVTESRNTRIQRLRRNGHTWKQIAERYNVSVTTARRWAT